MGERKQTTTLTQLFVVVVAVMVIAGLLPPLLARDYDVRNIAIAHYQVRDIANAIVAFYQDVGRWPNRDADGGDGLHALVSGGAAEALSGLFEDADMADRADLLNNHLAHNHPVGGHYDTEGEHGWHGPYLPDIGTDPWGHPYVVYMSALSTRHPEGAHKAIVVSAGPNGRVETPAVLGRATRFGGDDVGMAFFIRGEADEDDMNGNGMNRPLIAEERMTTPTG